MKIISKILLILFSLLILTAAAGGVYYLGVTANVKLDSSKLKLVQNNVSLLDKDGREIIKCSARGAGGVKYEDLPTHTVNAFICAEDKGFFSHNGLDYKRMAAALWRNITSHSFKEGASTISQQLIKNTQLSPEKTITRKLKEIKLTMQLEKKYSKTDILETYLNTIYFGHNCFGLESAARFYFNCPATDLSLADSAILAGMIKSPNNYSPLKNPQNCLKRRNFILKIMAENGYINQEERLSAEKAPLPTKGNDKEGFVESYLNAVFEKVEDVIGKNVYGGLKIYTYLDVNLQKELEKQAKNIQTDKSFCIIDNLSHGVKAFYSTIGGAKRLIGSTIKPLLVYAPALEENVISPATPVLDEKIDYAGYSPHNYDNEYHGYVSARESLANSYNVPAVKILNALSVKKGVSYLEKMNLPVDKNDYSLALALGGMQRGYALKDVCAAYATFANEGYFYDCAFIKKITDAKGTLLYERIENANKVFTDDSVTLLNDMLMTTAQTGTAKKLKNIPYEVCAKTGTCGNDNGNTDAYCISYTTQDTIGIWLGTADNAPMAKITGGGLPANINLNILEFLYKKEAPAPFKKSANVIECALDKREYEKNHALVLCDPNAPIQEKTLPELFKKNFKPKSQSSYFSRPALQKIYISCQKDGILIELCQAQYLTIVVNREESGVFKTIYQGKCDNFLDKDVVEGKTYVYSVTPYYNEFAGNTVIFPKIKYTKNGFAENKKDKAENHYIPKDWWR